MSDSLYHVIYPVADLLDSPENGYKVGKRDSQLLMGEPFNVESEDEDLFYGISGLDDQKGYIQKSSLKKQDKPPTHYVCVPLTHLYSEPSFKIRPSQPLSFLSRLILSDKREDGFILAPNHGWVFEGHLRPLGTPPEESITQTALKFLHTPYIYGGRSVLGLDCSALIQLTLLAHGIDCPRDTDQQQNTIGREIDLNDIQQGDIVYFKGHTGIMLDKEKILNATSRHMLTVIENLNDLIQIYGDPITIKRAK